MEKSFDTGCIIFYSSCCIFFVSSFSSSRCMYQMPFLGGRKDIHPTSTLGHFSCPGRIKSEQILRTQIVRDLPFTSSIVDACSFQILVVHHSTKNFAKPPKLTFLCESHNSTTQPSTVPRDGQHSYGRVLVRDCFGMLSRSFILSLSFFQCSL